MDNIHRIWATTPAVIMAAGAVPMISSNAPDHVRYGGICLAAIAAIIADLKSGKKLGYTDKIVDAIRKIPALKDADEGTVLGTLTIGASGFLGGGAALTIAETGSAWPEALKLGYNTVNYPLAALCDLKTTRQLLERYLPKEFSFARKNPDGTIERTDPIPTLPLLQQALLLTGALGITGYGTALDVGAIQFTGIMFAFSNGLSIGQLAGKPAADALVSRLKSFTAQPDIPLSAEEITQMTDAIRSASAEFAETLPPPPIMLDDGNLPKHIVQAAESTLREIDKDNGLNPPSVNSPAR